MTEFSAETWTLLGLVAGMGTLTILHTLARTFADEQKVHDLTLRVFDLRRSYAKRLVELGRDHPGGQEEIIEAIPIDEQPEELKKAA
jgi:hypothetical protein